jgi:hypothetical protein
MGVMDAKKKISRKKEDTVPATDTTETTATTTAATTAKKVEKKAAPEKVEKKAAPEKAEKKAAPVVDKGEKKRKKPKTFKASLTADKLLEMIDKKEITEVDALEKCGKKSVIAALKKRGGKITIDLSKVKNIEGYVHLEKDTFFTTFFSAVENF